jgi:hypothetical protein
MTVPIDQLPPEQRNQVITMCESTPCKQVKDQLVILKNQILALCTQIAAIKSRRDSYNTIGGILLGAAAAVAVGAAVTPWPFNLILWIVFSMLATAAAVMFILAAHEQNLLNIRNLDLQNLQNQFQQAVQVMLNACPPQCRSDPTLPTCPS